MKPAKSAPESGKDRLPFPFFRLQKVNLPNQLTLLRIALIPLFITLFMSDSVTAQWLALVVFGASAATDYFDGKIARERNLITNFGKIMDPLADKILMLTAMIYFVQVGLVPGWMIVVIWIRELGVTGLRTLVATRQKVLAADSWGKLKTVLQAVAIVTGLLLYVIQNTLNEVSPDWRLRLASHHWWGEDLGRLLDTNALPYWLMLVAAIVSLWSGIRYFRVNWRIVCQELEEAEKAEP
ncbi:MAG: CDP-diacylglycerol--glycerol-3-phosphate 3-phosphatidyltransferase [candidate division FCPU426 bacterium]